jgi:hypothetical protein
VNNQTTEAGVTAVGHAVGSANAALSLAIPTARYSRHDLPAYVEALRSCAARIERELQTSGTGVGLDWQGVVPGRRMTGYDTAAPSPMRRTASRRG